MIQKLRVPLTVVALVSFGISLYLNLAYAPEEQVMGAVQRIFYQHIAAGWLFSLAFFVTLVAGIAYLATRNLRWDSIAISSAEIGVLFTLLNIISGAIWARPVWNTWWNWDPRLVTATVTLLLYIAYFLFRQALLDPHRRAQLASVYGIGAFVSVPLTIVSIRIWRTIHPIIVNSGDPTAQGSFSMTPEMRLTMFATLIAFTFGYLALLLWRVNLEQTSQALATRKMNLIP